MTTRIALHYLRQSWGMYLVAMLPLVVLWTGAAEAGALSRQVVLAITLGVAALIGPATTTTRMTPTEVRLLPISRHRLWVARWLVSVVVPTLWVGACMLAGRTQTVALTRLGTLGADTAGLALVTVFLYLGMVMALHALTGVVRFADGRLRPGWLWGACRLGLHLGAAGSVFWGFLFRKYLPVSIDGLSVGMLVVLALGAVATLAGAMYRPDPGAFVDARQLSAAPLKATARWQRFDDPFTGLPKLFWWTWRELSVPLVLMFACVTVVEFGWPGWGIELEEMLPFGRVAEGLPSILIMMVILLAGQAGDLPGQTDVTASTARHLRVLPLNPMALTFYLVFRRAVGWLTLWVGAIALYALVVGRPELLRLDWLLFLVGIDAMVDAVRLRAGIRRSIAVPLLLAAVFAIATVVVNGLAGGPTLASVAQVLIGTVALAAAVIVHHGAVRSGTALYTASGSDGLSGASALGQ
jgi:hypothetical protein